MTGMVRATQALEDVNATQDGTGKIVLTNVALNIMVGFATCKVIVSRVTHTGLTLGIA